MTRRSLISVALAVGLAAAFVAACGNTFTRLTDPAAILDAAATNAETAKSVRLDVAVDGTLALGLLGGGPVDLTGTTASADIDLANADLKATFAVPAILNLAGDIILLDDTLAYRTTLTGQQYQSMQLDEEPGPFLDGLIALLRDPSLEPTLGEDEPCAGGTCYAVTVRPDPAELGSVVAGLPLPDGLPIPIPDLSGADITATILVEQSTNRLAGLRITVTGEGVGDLTADATFTKWDEPVTIEIPEGSGNGG